MFCPVCNHKDTKVTDSRISAEGMNIRRRRECIKCGYRFSTLEEIEILDLLVVKRNGRKEPYSREKLERGVRTALEKRPVTQEEFNGLINSIERDIQKKRKSELTSIEIGEIILRRLRQFDPIAYIRFASVYHGYDSIREFQRELSHLLKTARKKKKRGAR